MADHWDGFDAIIDVRSPAEFAEDHIPGAINLPALSDEERALVGTVYKQESPFKARKIGAALVARNAANHIEAHLMGHKGGWRPLVYCWRGGQRSGSFATILREIGWQVETLDGGYRSYRRCVAAGLYDTPLALRFYRLDGYTGTAKTAVLQGVGNRGFQVLDLEGLARHRGSALGDVLGAQPTQKSFESALYQRVCALDPARPVLVEAESARIGALRLPPALWHAMCQAPRLVIDAPPKARAQYLADTYQDLTQDLDQLLPRLDMLRPLQGHGKVDAWQKLARVGAFEDLALALITDHYDPAYARLRRKDSARPVAEFRSEALTDSAVSELARQIAQWLSAAK